MGLAEEVLSRRLEQEILGIKGVVGVSARDPRGEPEIIVYVEEPWVARTIPRTLSGLPVRVVVAGRIRIYPLQPRLSSLLSIAVSSVRDRVRPVVAGVSVSDPTGTAGTVGYVSEALQLVSNAHVIGIDWRNRVEYKPFSRTPVIQPGRYDGGRLETDVVGEHITTVLDEYRDLAVARAYPDRVLPKRIYGLGNVVGWTEPVVNMPVSKVGRTTGFTSSIVFDVNATVRVWGYPGGARVFRRQVVVYNPGSSFMAPGDSGSLLVTRVAGKLVAVGLCFAGSEVVAIANRIRYVVEKGVELGPYIPYPEQDSFTGMLSRFFLGSTPLLLATSGLLGVEAENIL